ncbi:unnamed protein product [Amoebophrya sp. A120]|nr:unnamed protein product [Amoebophrya sp. A120]|eukprot:GSA120T00004091001.1
MSTEDQELLGVLQGRKRKKVPAKTEGATTPAGIQGEKEKVPAHDSTGDDAVPVASQEQERSTMQDREEAGQQEDLLHRTRNKSKNQDGGTTSEQNNPPKKPKIVLMGDDSGSAAQVVPIPEAQPIPPAYLDDQVRGPLSAQKTYGKGPSLKEDIALVKQANGREPHEFLYSEATAQEEPGGFALSQKLAGPTPGSSAGTMYQAPLTQESREKVRLQQKQLQETPGGTEMYANFHGASIPAYQLVDNNTGKVPASLRPATRGADVVAAVAGASAKMQAQPSPSPTAGDGADTLSKIERAAGALNFSDRVRQEVPSKMGGSSREGATPAGGVSSASSPARTFMKPVGTSSGAATQARAAVEDRSKMNTVATAADNDAIAKTEQMLMVMAATDIAQAEEQLLQQQATQSKAPAAANGSNKMVTRTTSTGSRQGEAGITANAGSLMATAFKDVSEFEVGIRAGGDHEYHAAKKHKKGHTSEGPTVDDATLMVTAVLGVSDEFEQARSAKGMVKHKASTARAKALHKAKQHAVSGATSEEKRHVGRKKTLENPIAGHEQATQTGASLLADVDSEDQALPAAALVVAESKATGTDELDTYEEAVYPVENEQFAPATMPEARMADSRETEEPAGLLITDFVSASDRSGAETATTAAEMRRQRAVQRSRKHNQRKLNAEEIPTELPIPHGHGGEQAVPYAGYTSARTSPQDNSGGKNPELRAEAVVDNTGVDFVEQATLVSPMEFQAATVLQKPGTPGAAYDTLQVLTNYLSSPSDGDSSPSAGATAVPAPGYLQPDHEAELYRKQKLAASKNNLNSLLAENVFGGGPELPDDETAGARRDLVSTYPDEDNYARVRVQVQRGPFCTKQCVLVVIVLFLLLVVGVGFYLHAAGYSIRVVWDDGWHFYKLQFLKTVSVPTDDTATTNIKSRTASSTPVPTTPGRKTTEGSPSEMRPTARISGAAFLQEDHALARSQGARHVGDAWRHQQHARTPSAKVEEPTLLELHDEDHANNGAGIHGATRWSRSYDLQRDGGGREQLEATFLGSAQDEAKHSPRFGLETIMDAATEDVLGARQTAKPALAPETQPSGGNRFGASENSADRGATANVNPSGVAGAAYVEV